MKEFPKKFGFEEKIRKIKRETLEEILKRENLDEEFLMNNLDEFICVSDVLTKKKFGEENLQKILNKYGKCKQVKKAISTSQILSESFIEKNKEKICWTTISLYQKLSESFIQKHMDKLYVDHLIERQDLSDEFILKNSHRWGGWRVMNKPRGAGVTKRYINEIESERLKNFLKLENPEETILFLLETESLDEKYKLQLILNIRFGICGKNLTENFYKSEILKKMNIPVYTLVKSLVGKGFSEDFFRNEILNEKEELHKLHFLEVIKVKKNADYLTPEELREVFEHYKEQEILAIFFSDEKNIEKPGFKKIFEENKEEIALSIIMKYPEKFSLKLLQKVNSVEVLEELIEKRDRFDNKIDPIVQKKAEEKLKTKKMFA